MTVVNIQYGKVLWTCGELGFGRGKWQNFWVPSVNTFGPQWSKSLVWLLSLDKPSSTMPNCQLPALVWSGQMPKKKGYSSTGWVLVLQFFRAGPLAPPVVRWWMLTYLPVLRERNRWGLAWVSAAVPPTHSPLILGKPQEKANCFETRMGLLWPRLGLCSHLWSKPAEGR